MPKKRQEQGFRRALHEPMLQGDLSAWLGWWPERLPASDVLAAWQAALERRGHPGSPATVQLYVHFALCQSSCRFCMYFHVVPRDEEQVARYTDYLVATLERYRRTLGRVEISTAYFGGGTPSAFPTPALSRFLSVFAEAFHVNGEFTCEAHPSNLDEDKLELLHDAGVNRLSMGLQSFDAAVLKRIGRTNPSLDRVEALVRYARQLGMWTNTDLVVGLPGQTPDSFHADLDRLLTRARPDCITLYRYQPVARLPDIPPEQMSYSRVLSRTVTAHALRQGYLPATTGGDERLQKSFLRNSGRTWRYFADRLRFEARRLLRADAELPVYETFENGETHTLGIGPGAVSHVYGHSWYREATAVDDDLSAASEPVYLGTRLTPVDECRSALLQCFARHHWISTRALQRRSGIDVNATFGPSLDAGVKYGVLRRAGHWYASVPGTPPATRIEVLESFLPTIAADATARAERLAEISALRTADHVQSELVAVGDDLFAPDEMWPDLDVSSTAAAGAGAVLSAWAELIGLGAPGQRFADAFIDRVGGSQVDFHVLAQPAPALQVIVERDAGQPSFLRAGPYAISYASRQNATLAPAEEKFLRELQTRTAAALAAMSGATTAPSLRPPQSSVMTR